MFVANVGRPAKHKAALSRLPTTNACHRVHKKGTVCTVRLEPRRAGKTGDPWLCNNVPIDRQVTSIRKSWQNRLCTKRSIAMDHREWRSQTMSFRYQTIQTELTDRERTNLPTRPNVFCSGIEFRESVVAVSRYSARLYRHRWM